jgi:DNA-binding MarR family transcriptional regulator
MTNILHDLERRGLVERRPDPEDRRGVVIRLTPQAVGMMGAAIEAHVAEEHRMIAGLAMKERAVLESLLSKLLFSLEPVAAPVPAMRRSSANKRLTPRRRTAAR